MNQHLKLLSLLSLAIYVHVDYVALPCAFSRDSIDTHLPTWRPEAASTLWDIPSIRKLLATHGIRVLMQPVAPDAGPSPDAVVMPSFFARGAPVDVIAEDVQRRSREHLARLGAPTSNLTIYAPDLLLTFNTTGWAIYAEVARGVLFAPQLTALAASMVSRLVDAPPVAAGSAAPPPAGAGFFNGLHLRMEGDFLQTHNGSSVAAELGKYAAAVAALPRRSVPLYVASGIFRRGGRADSSRYSPVEAWLMDLVVFGQHASRVVNRQVLLHGAMRQALGSRTPLHSEQRAAIDFLVLLHSDHLVGPGMSSFTFALREYRAMLGGRGRHSTTLVGPLEQFFPVAAGIAHLP